jgi:WD40 repeat protein/DNA-binding SARP family transcriptional activator
MSGSLEIYALGTLAIQRDRAPINGFTSRKVEALLVYLAYTQRAHSREFLAELLWDERSQAQAMGNLRQVVFDLRQRLAPYIVVTRQAVALNPDHVTWLDAGELERQLHTASQQWMKSGGPSPTAVDGLEQTLALYQGDFLTGFYVRDCKAFEEWMLQERERLRRQVIEALQRLVDSYLGSGAYTAGIAQATRLLRLEPLLEEAHRQMMLLLIKAGQRSAALIQYETCRRLLAEELDVKPTRETTALYEEIRAGELAASLVSAPPSLHVAEKETSAEPKNPYKGLRAFQEVDAPDFFGRETLVEQLTKRLAEPAEATRFLAVVGPSGSGKSSVVKAGLIPALRSGGLPNSECWLIVEMFPGAYPLEELEAALLRIAVNPPSSLIDQLREDERGLGRAIKRVLPGDDTELVLIIDQFEEVFTFLKDEAARTHFLDSLHLAISDPRSRVRVIITLRADFMDRSLCYGRFGDLVRQRTEFVLPLSPDDLQRAISGPARRVGLTLDTDLIAAILRDVDQQPGALPLLQYALTELFERRQDNRLTLTAYRESSGVTGALARRADNLYDGLDATSQAAARQLFLRLITLGEGIEDTRRRVWQTELASITEHTHALEHMIDVFSKYRLLTLDRDPLTGGPTLEVAHEALIRSWERLHEWLDESREDLRIHRRLTAATAEWMNAARDSSFLATGARLSQFEALAAGSDLALNREEQEYLQVSVAEREWQEAAERRRQAREATLERRSRNFLRSLVAVLVVATLIGFGLAALAITQGQIAQQSAVESQNVALQAGSHAALANFNTDLALALAVEAVKLNPTSAPAQVALAQAAYAPGTVRRFIGHSDEVWAVAFSPDGLTALSGGKDSMVILWDVTTGQTIHRMAGHKGMVLGVAFSPDGKTAISGADDKTLILWDVATGKITRRMEGHTDAVRCVAFSRDGKTIISGSGDKQVILWDVTTGQIIRRMEGHTDAVFSIALSADGRTALSGSYDMTLILWDMATGKMIRQLTGPTRIDAVALSGDAHYALSAGSDTVIYLWDVTTGQIIRRFKRHSSPVYALVFSPDGRTFLSGATDETMIQWELETGQILRRFLGHSAMINRVALNADGRFALSGSTDKTIRLWDLSDGHIIQRFVGHTSVVVKASLSPDGRKALSSSWDGQAILWDVQTGKQLHKLTEGELWWSTFSPDGRTALVAVAKFGVNPIPCDVILWDVETGKIVRRFVGHQSAVFGMAFSPDGRTFMSGDGTGDLRLWDVASGEVIRQFVGQKSGPWGIAFSPDGRTALVGDFFGTLILWDVTSGQIIHQMKAYTAPVNSTMFSRDGRTALTGGSEGAILWDIASGTIIRRFIGGNTHSVTFSPDDRAVLGGISDDTTVLWNVATGQVIRHFIGASEGIQSANFTADGKKVLVSFPDGRVELWRIDSPDELIAWIHANRYVIVLGCDQRQLYRLSPACDANGVFPTQS